MYDLEHDIIIKNDKDISDSNYTSDNYMKITSLVLIKSVFFILHCWLTNFRLLWKKKELQQF